MSASRRGFIDVMKCLGMALIVFGHFGGSLTAHLTPPIYLKQLGVAFFVFVAGFTLAQERRPTPEVLYRRLFEIVVVGFTFAILMSAVTYARIADLAESNYLPFLLGANVLVDDFPANPTTWFIGTYIQILIIWSVFLRSRRLRMQWLVVVATSEILTRGVLVARGTSFIAYMAPTNWASVFLAGIYTAQHFEDGASRPRRPGWPLAGLGAMSIGWPILARRLFDPGPGFPFMAFRAGTPSASLVLASASATLVYVAFTLLVYRISRPLDAPAWVRFLSRNTPLIFIGHMPIYHGLRNLDLISRLPYGIRVASLFSIGFFGLAVMSELLRRLSSLAEIRDRIWAGVTRRPCGSIAPDRLPRGAVPRRDIDLTDTATPRPG